MLSDDPPSYESIIAEFQASLDAFGPDLKPQDFFDTYNLLPATHVTVLAANPQALPTIPDEKSDAYITGALNALSSPEVAGHMDAAAGSAAQSCTIINGIFVELMIDISNIDATYKIPDPFSPKLDIICKSFQDIMKQSKESATNISSYANTFSTITIPICTDMTWTLERRKQEINQFISDCASFEPDASKFQSDFDGLITSLATFTGKFTSWAASEKVSLDDTIKKLNKDISALEDQLQNLQKLLVDAIAAILVLATALWDAMLVAGPFAPYVAVAGAIAAGIAIAAVATLVAKINTCNQNIEDDKAAVKAAEAEIKEIDSVLSSFETIAGRDLTIFTSNIGVLSGVWGRLGKDSISIKAFLDNAEEHDDMPPIMVKELNQAGSLYTAIAYYLTQYADSPSWVIPTSS